MILTVFFTLLSKLFFSGNRTDDSIINEFYFPFLDKKDP